MKNSKLVAILVMVLVGLTVTHASALQLKTKSSSTFVLKTKSSSPAVVYQQGSNANVNNGEEVRAKRDLRVSNYRTNSSGLKMKSNVRLKMKTNSRSSNYSRSSVRLKMKRGSGYYGGTYGSDCKYRLFDLFGECDEVQSKIVDDFLFEYAEYKSYRLQKQPYINDIAALNDRKIELTIMNEDPNMGLTDQEYSEYQNIASNVANAEQELQSLNQNMMQSGIVLKGFEREYKNSGGSGSLRDVAQDQMDEILDY